MKFAMSAVSDTIRYVGVNDHALDLFEGQYVVPNGMSYNSYVILDDKVCVMDTVDAKCLDAWMENLKEALDGRLPDYLVVLHMEPDHSANILNFMEAYPDAVVVSSAAAFRMMQQFFGTDFADRRLVMAEGSTLELGTHTLQFFTAPMVHWPEVLVAYDALEKVLFSADAFGKFGALDVEEPWEDEARRYYFGIVGKYGGPAQALLKKASGLDISVICPLHGPVLSENLEKYLNLYQTWTSYTPETEGILIAYTSIYGNTKKAVELLAERLQDEYKGRTVVMDLARTDMSKAVEEAFRMSTLVLATTTYNGDIFPFMRQFIDHLTERNFQNRTVAFMENGSWAPMAKKVMSGMLERCKDLKLLEQSVTLRSALSQESLAQLNDLAAALCE